MEKERKTRWYVQPLSGPTNQALASELSKLSNCEEVMQLKVGDKIVTNLYLVPDYHTVAMLYNDSVSYQFNVYRQQGKNGAAYEWKFGEGRRKMTRPK
ncbi:MAG: hypothetical protein Q8Q67_00435 [bacterium]|nr:hypothetical protein [bacterium]